MGDVQPLQPHGVLSFWHSHQAVVLGIDGWHYCPQLAEGLDLQHSACERSDSSWSVFFFITDATDLQAVAPAILF